nr:anti-sigma factor [Microlunatus antarcticus]
MRASVLAGIADVEQLPPLPGRPRRALASVDPVEVDDPPVVADTAASPLVDELALRRVSRRARVLSVLVAAVTVVALALGGVAISLVRQAQQPQVAEPQVTQTPQPPQVDPALLAAPDARIRRTKLIDGTEVSFVVSKEQNRAAFVSADLPSPGAGNEYHLWTLKGDTVVRPDATLPGGTNQVQLFTGPVSDSTALAINIEPTGTAPQAPTTEVLGAVTI